MRRIVHFRDIDGIASIMPREARIAARHTKLNRVADPSAASEVARIFDGICVESHTGIDVIAGGIVIPVTGDMPSIDIASDMGMPEKPAKTYRAVKYWGDPRLSDEKD